MKKHLDNRRLEILHLTEKNEETRSQKGRIFAGARCADNEDMKSFAEKQDQTKRD